MKIRPQIYLLGILLIPMLSGCVRGCYKSQDTVLTQTPIGDPAAPDVSIASFVFDAKPETLACQIATPIRVELYIDASGVVQNVTFLDNWPSDCARKYVQNTRGSKIIVSPLAGPLEHFRIDLRSNRIDSQQCLRLQN